MQNIISNLVPSTPFSKIEAYNVSWAQVKSPAGDTLAARVKNATVDTFANLAKCVFNAGAVIVNLGITGINKVITLVHPQPVAVVSQPVQEEENHLQMVVYKAPVEEVAIRDQAVLLLKDVPENVPAAVIKLEDEIKQDQIVQPSFNWKPAAQVGVALLGAAAVVGVVYYNQDQLGRVANEVGPTLRAYGTYFYGLREDAITAIRGFATKACQNVGICKANAEG